MQYFTDDFQQFFKELSQNNHKEWFHSQKKRYESTVKEPFRTFLADLIAEIQQHDPTLDVEPKDCVLRINRDVRFSKDKSPYNLHVTAFVSQGGRRDKSIPGLFVRFSADQVGIMGGAFGPSKEQLADIRQAIAADIGGFRKLISNKKFTSKFETIRGEAHKRPPKELAEAIEQEPLILNKQFYFMAEREADLLTSKKLLPEMMTYWHAARPVNEFLHNSFVS